MGDAERSANVSFGDQRRAPALPRHKVERRRRFCGSCGSRIPRVCAPTFAPRLFTSTRYRRGRRLTGVQRLLLGWYARTGRNHLPWRKTRDPYRVLVSEVMLQQTQVDRVIPKYEAFIERFPDISSLASSSAADVLRMWAGLGYNSRAIRLKRVAEVVEERYTGRMPSDTEALRSL